jgi:chemotaxis protein MotB
MAGDAKKLQPIIIKRVKKGGHAAHGGAWKIAYADFVTAMMAFFLLMWLLGSTTECDKKGIADYFQAPLKMSLLNAGAGAGDSSHVVKGGGQDVTRSTGQVKRGDVVAEKSTLNVHQMKAEQFRAEVARLEDLKRKMEAKIAADAKLAAMASQILLEMTPDGLRIQIVDADGKPMFASGSPVVQPGMRELLRMIGGLLAEVPNRLTLEGHTDAVPFSRNSPHANASAHASAHANAHANGKAEQGYSNWELSADRANASRRELLGGGLPEDQVLRVQGLAASNPFDRSDPTAANNRRISIVVMTREAEDRVFRTTPAPPPEVIDAAPAAALPMAAGAAGAAAAVTARSSPAPAHR